MATISLCMIVYNEEKNMKRCLESICKHVDEIIVVDTGSTDMTKSICKSFGAKVFDYNWTDDFAQARNFSLSKATSDWIFLLDADEELEIYDFPAFKAYLENNTHDLISVPMIHFYDEENIDKNYSHISSAIRVLRNKRNIQFTGKIHESIDAEGFNIDEHNDTTPFMKILHYGYTKTALEEKKDRNFTALIKEKEEQPGNPWIDYHIAAQYHQSNDFVKAYEHVNLSIMGFMENGVIPPAIAYKLKYEMLIATANFGTAYPSIEKAIELYPDYVDLHFYKGILLYSYKEYDEAIEAFFHCLTLGETNKKYLILSGTGSFYALHYLGLCYEGQEKFQQAMEAYKKALDMFPRFKIAKEKLEDLLQQNKF